MKGLVFFPTIWFHYRRPPCYEDKSIHYTARTKLNESIWLDQMTTFKRRAHQTEANDSIVLTE